MLNTSGTTRFKRTIHSVGVHDRHVQHCKAQFEVQFPQLDEIDRSALLLAVHNYSRHGSIIMLSMFEYIEGVTMQSLLRLEELCKANGSIEMVLHVFDDETKRFNVDHYQLKFQCASTYEEWGRPHVLVVLTEV